MVTLGEDERGSAMGKESPLICWAAEVWKDWETIPLSLLFQKHLEYQQQE